MFTGIVEEIGNVKNLFSDDVSGTLEFEAQRVLEGTKLGDSIAVNGVCLTVTQMTNRSFRADVMAETLRRSNLAALNPGSRVNLERAMAADGRFGGHIVSGHIDAVGTIAAKETEGRAVWVTISAERDLLALVVEKGSIAIDGISLTVASVNDTQFQVSVIPHTGAETTLLKKEPGEPVNLEQDIVGKYVQKLLGLATKPSPGINEDLSLDFLLRHGF